MLSRIPIAAVEEYNPIYSIEQIREQQKSDPKCKEIMQKLSQSNSTNNNGDYAKYFLDGSDILYRKKQCQMQREVWHQLVVPRSMVGYNTIYLSRCTYFRPCQC